MSGRELSVGGSNWGGIVREEIVHGRKCPWGIAPGGSVRSPFYTLLKAK